MGLGREAKLNREDCIFISALIGTGNVQAGRMKVSLKKPCLIIVSYIVGPQVMLGTRFYGAT